MKYLAIRKSSDGKILAQGPSGAGSFGLTTEIFISSHPALG